MNDVFEAIAILVGVAVITAFLWLGILFTVVDYRSFESIADQCQRYNRIQNSEITIRCEVKR